MYEIVQKQHVLIDLMSTVSWRQLKCRLPERRPNPTLPADHRRGLPRSLEIAPEGRLSDTPLLRYLEWTKCIEVSGK